MIAIEELNNARGGDAFQRDITYRVVGTDSDSEMDEDAAIQAVIGSTPDERGGLFRTNAQIVGFWLTPTSTIAHITMQWGELEGGGAISVPGGADAVYEFAYQAEQGHHYYAIATQAYGSSPPDLQNRINVSGDGETLGLPGPACGTSNVWRLTVPSGFVTSTYEAFVEGMMGAVNSTPFKGRPAGTMRLVQVQSQAARGGGATISWGLRYSPNQTNITLHGISGVNIGGHDVWWPYEKKIEDLAAKVVKVSTKWIYVHRVCPLADLNLLGF